MGGGAGKTLGKDLVRPLNPNLKAHNPSDFKQNFNNITGKNVFGNGTDAPTPGSPVYSSIYPNGFPDAWGRLSPMPAVNPLAQMQWLSPQQIGSFMTNNSELANLRGPSALAAGSFMSRLAALQGQNGGGNNGS